MIFEDVVGQNLSTASSMDGDPSHGRNGPRLLGGSLFGEPNNIGSTQQHRQQLFPPCWNIEDRHRLQLLEACLLYFPKNPLKGLGTMSPPSRPHLPLPP